MTYITAFPPLFEARRKLALPALEVHDFTADDGTVLRLHHAPGGPRGPLLLAPGTAMSGLSMCLDTVPCNLTEYLHAEGFDVWLLDWRTSPLLPAHRHPYSLLDVARHDWPSAVAAVRAKTGGRRVGVLAHCLSSTALFLSILRGHLKTEHLSAIVASQVAMHLTMNIVGRLKTLSHADLLLPAQQLIHLRPDEVTLHVADAAITALAAIVPQVCASSSCQRQTATFGELVQHERLNDATHALLGELIPEVSAGFLCDVVPLSRHGSILDAAALANLHRLALPITLLSGEHNQTLVPQSTEASYEALCAVNDPSLYLRHVIAGYGHLDCLLGARAHEDVFPHISAAFLRAERGADHAV